MQGLLRRETRWLPTGLDGTEVAELDNHEADVPATARFIAIRHRIKDQRSRAGSKLLIDCPGYLYQVLVTNLPRSVPLVETWRDYNGRAVCENVIKELDAGYGLPDLACKDFWATEAALSFGVLAHNLIVRFERKLGWLEAVLGQPALLAVRDRRDHRPPAGPDDDQTRRPGARTRLVARPLGETSLAQSQLQCSRNSPEVRVAPTRENHLKTTLLLHGYGLER